MNNKQYLGNAFSLQMLDLSVGNTIDIIPVPEDEVKLMLDKVKKGQIISVIGHQDLANILGVPCNRISIMLNPDDILYIAQVTGGRLTEGCTKLPENYKLTFVKVKNYG